MPAIRETRVDLEALLEGPAATPGVGGDDDDNNNNMMDSNAVTAQLVVPCHNILGEGIIYDDRSEAVMWTDIMASSLHKLELSSKSNARFATYEMPRKVGSIGLLNATVAADSLPILCAWEDGFQIYDVEHERGLSEKSVGEDVNPAKGPTRLNDGRTDPTGRRFICGGYYGDQKGTKMKVYRVEQRDGKLCHEPFVDGMEVTNSISWSPDGKTMYLADSPTNEICSYDYDGEKGEISNKKVLHTKTDPEEGVPDGTCVDAEGYLWNAVWRSGAGPGMVQRIDPSSGEVVFTVHMPDTTSQVTCCCFGGKDFDILFITTAAENRDQNLEPNAGGLYAVKLPFKGKPESRLDFQV